jgi:hypothetical protein
MEAMKSGNALDSKFICGARAGSISQLSSFGQ